MYTKEKLKEKIAELKRNRWVQAAIDNRELIAAVSLMVAGTIIVVKSFPKNGEMVKLSKHVVPTYVDQAAAAPQSFYSYMGSPLQFILRDDIAEGFNRASDEFHNAQLRHREKYGVDWSPSVPLLMRWNRKDKENYDAVGSIIKLLVNINGGGLDVPDWMLATDHLEKIEHPVIS